MRYVLLSLLGVATAAATSSPRRPTAQAEGPTQVVEITAERFAFSPSEIRTKAGTTLEIRLRSDDTAHGFRIVGTDVNVAPRQRGRGVVTVTFVP